MFTLSYKAFTDNSVVNKLIPIQDIKRILGECKVIDIKAKEPFPEGAVTFVGVGNDNYECRTLWDIRYTDHMELTYGGYFNKDHSGYHAWWTMNYNYSNEYDKTKAYIVKNRYDGDKLAAFLNYVGDLNNIQGTIMRKVREIEQIKEEIKYLIDADKALKAPEGMYNLNK